MGLRFFSGGLLIGIVALLGGDVAFGHGIPSRILEPAAEKLFRSYTSSPTRRYAVQSFLKSTAEGRLMAERMKIHTLEDLAETLATERAAPLAEALEGRLAKIDGTIKDFRKARRENGETISNKLTSKDKFLLRFLVERNLKLADPDSVVQSLLPSSSRRFFSSPSSQRLSLQKAFLDLEPASPLPFGNDLPPLRPDAPVPPASSAVESLANREVEDWFTRLKACGKARWNGTQPIQAGRQSDQSLQWMKLFINSNSAVASYVHAVGARNVDVGDLSTDWLMTILATTVGSKLMAGQMSLKVRWMRILAFGAGRTVVDGTIYALDPVDWVREGKRADITLDGLSSRAAYNMTYNVVTSPKSAATYILFSSILDCYPRNAKVQRRVFWAQLTENIGSTFAFFHVREWWYNQWNELVPR